MIDEIIVSLNKKEVKIFDLNDYLDNASFASKGEHLFFDIFSELKKQKNVTFSKGKFLNKIENTEQLLIFMTENGYSYYIGVLLEQFYFYEKHKIQYENNCP